MNIVMEATEGAKVFTLTITNDAPMTNGQVVGAILHAVDELKIAITEDAKEKGTTQ